MKGVPGDGDGPEESAAIAYLRFDFWLWRFIRRSMRFIAVRSCSSLVRSCSSLGCTYFCTVRSDPCPSRAARVGRSALSSAAARVANVWRRSYGTKSTVTPSFAASATIASWAELMREMCAPRFLFEGKIHLDGPSHSLFKNLPGFGGHVEVALRSLRFAANDMDIAPREIKIGLRQRGNLLRSHTRAAIVRGGSHYEPQGSRWYFPQVYRLSEHGKYLLMSPGMDRSGAIGFRCVMDAE